MSRLEFLRSLQDDRAGEPRPPPALKPEARSHASPLAEMAIQEPLSHVIAPIAVEPPIVIPAIVAESMIPGKAASPDGLEALEQTLHVKLVNALNPGELERLPPAGRRALMMRMIEMLLNAENVLLSPAQRKHVIEDLIDETLGLGPLETLLRDPTISDILVNGCNKIYVERRGRLERSTVHFRSDAHLMQIIRRIVSSVGRRVDESSPMVDARLADGSRVNAIIPPLSLSGPMLSIRRFGAHRMQMSDLIALKTLAPAMARLLELAVKAKLNMIISGGTGSGKTTMLNVLSGFIPSDERIITIEDAAELQLQQEHVGSLESRPPNIEGKGAITIRDLLRNALRMRPDRIIIGECRGAEALDMLQVMNTGHEGSMSTLHANNPRDALSRLEMMILMGGMDLPLTAIRQQIASSIHLIVQVSRLTGGARKVTSISEVVGMEQDVVSMQELFAFQQTGVDLAKRATGHFEATGLRPHCEAKFTAAGIALPAEMFQQGVIAEF